MGSAAGGESAWSAARRAGLAPGLSVVRGMERVATAGIRGRARRNADTALEHMASADRLDDARPRPPETEPAPHHDRPSTHRLLTYTDLPEFLAVAVPFLREGHAAGDRMLVITPAATTEALRTQLPADAEVDFVDAHTWYRTPAQTMAAFSEYLTQHAHRPGLRMIGEPTLAGRSDSECAEWACYEAALNVAFPRGGIQVICAYAGADLPPAVQVEARRTHPLLASGAACPDFVRPRGYVPVAEPPLPSPPLTAGSTRVEAGDLDAVQRFVTRQAFDAGVFGRHARSFGLAAREAARDLLPDASSRGRVRVWTQERHLVCELESPRPAMPRISGYLPPTDAAEPGGLWLARQLCPLVHVRSEDGSVRVRLHHAPAYP